MDNGRETASSRFPTRSNHLQVTCRLITPHPLNGKPKIPVQTWRWNRVLPEPASIWPSC